jgi:hypothetical protein
MSSVSTSAVDELERDGYTNLPSVYTQEEVGQILTGLGAALGSGASPAIRGEEGAVFAARNVLTLWPAVATVWRRPPIEALLREVLGPGCGLVRVLYFDKPPGQSWALPWHKDLTVAVQDNRLPGAHFRKPTAKAGVPHAEAPLGVLESMLTVRIHLDPVTGENGPLRVVPGSHKAGKSLDLAGAEVRTLYARAGDVLLVRPLVAHCSNRSAEGTTLHRRILHLEFTKSGPLPDGFVWHDYIPLAAGSGRAGEP